MMSAVFLFNLLFGVAAIAGGIFGAFSMALKPLLAVYLIFALMVFETTLLQPVYLDAGIIFYPADILFLMISAAFMIRTASIVKTNRVPRAWWILGITQFILFIWGVGMVGKTAGVDYRIHFYAWIATAYFCTVKASPALLQRINNALVFTACALCLLIYYRWVSAALDPVYAALLEEFVTTGVSFRVVGSSPTLIIAMAACALMYKATTKGISFAQWLLMPIFVLTVIALQHRSVWVSLAAGIMILTYAMQRQRGAGKTAIAILALALPLVFGASFAGKDSSVIASVKSSADRAMSTDEGTMVSRVSRWNELLENWVNSRNPVTYAIGKPYGSGYASVVSEDGKQTVDFSPHNHFVHILYRGGLLGLFATLSVFYQLWNAGTRQLRDRNENWAPYFLAIFAVLLSFYIPYWVSYWHGIFLGIAISYFGIAGNTQKQAAAYDPRNARAWS